MLSVVFELKIASPSGSLSYWGTQSLQPSTTITDQGAAVLGCVRCMIVWTRTTPTGLDEDVCTMNLNIAKQAGNLRSSFSPGADLNAVAARLDTFILALNVHQSSAYTVREIRYYKQFEGQTSLGPPMTVVANGNTGDVAGARVPDQLSPTITLINASRKHWGRMYIPGVKAAAYDTTYGRLTSTVADAFALAAKNLGTGLDTDGFELGVYSRVSSSFLDTWKIQVDDVPDIQRSRRAKQRNYAKVYDS